MTGALASAVEQAERLPQDEQDAPAAIVVEEIASDRRCSESFVNAPNALEAFASEALAESKAGTTRPLDASS